MLKNPNLLKPRTIAVQAKMWQASERKAIREDRWFHWKATIGDMVDQDEREDRDLRQACGISVLVLRRDVVPVPQLLEYLIKMRWIVHVLARSRTGCARTKCWVVS